MKSFYGTIVRDIHDNIKSILRHKPECIILYAGTNNALKLQPNEINIEKMNRDSKVNISTRTYRFGNRKTDNTANELTNMLINLNVTVVNNKNMSQKHLG